MAAFHCGGGVLIACFITVFIHESAGFNRVEVTSGNNVTIEHKKDPMTTRWSHWDKGWLCNVTGRHAPLVNNGSSVCVTNCTHTSLDLCNITKGNDGVVDLGRWFGENRDEYSGELWYLTAKNQV